MECSGVAASTRAGVSTRAFYREFESKDELFLAMLRQDFAGFLDTPDLEPEQGHVRENRYGVRFLHDFPRLDPEQIAAVQGHLSLSRSA